MGRAAVPVGADGNPPAVNGAIAIVPYMDARHATKSAAHADDAFVQGFFHFSK